MIQRWPAPANQPAGDVDQDKAKVIDLRDARNPDVDHQDHTDAGVPVQRDRWDAR